MRGWVGMPAGVVVRGLKDWTHFMYLQKIVTLNTLPNDVVHVVGIQTVTILSAMI